MYPGGYQMVNMNGAKITSGSATVITDARIAEILRTTNKQVYFYNITVDDISTNVATDIRTNTGATDGKVYGFIGPNSSFFNVSTADNKITFMPG